MAARITGETLARRGEGYADEVRRLLDAGLDVMRRCGTDQRPRVADIVAAAGLSNDAFYRHFKSKDALVTAILDDGAERLRGYLEHQVAKARTPEGRVRRWVEGVLAQADEQVAATTLAVLWNGSASVDGSADGRHAEVLAPLLVEPFTELGSAHPAEHAALATYAAMGRLQHHLRAGPATAADVERVTAFCLAAVAG